MQTKQAKILDEKQIEYALTHIARASRYPARDKVRFLLSVKAGLRAKEIAALTWAMVEDAQGAVSETIELPNWASKGRKGGRSIPIHPALKRALVNLKAEQGTLARGDNKIAYSERDEGISASAMAVWFHRLYRKLGFTGASSHSGRRTFITRLARVIQTAGGSVRDVQRLAGHASLDMTMRYIEPSLPAMRRAVEMV